MNDVIHDVYRVLTVDGNKAYNLLEGDTLLLSCHLGLSELTETCVMDLLGIHDKVLSALMCRSDDDSDEFKEVLKRSTKYMLVFLLSFLDYKELSDDLASQLIAFVLKLCRLYSTHPSLVDHWLSVSLKEPDISYTLHNKMSTINCFPVYEIARIFLLLEDQNVDLARESLQLLVSISNTSVYLKEWLIESDFLDSLLAGVLLNFNRLPGTCFDNDEFLLTTKSFEKFDASLTFVMKILRTSKSNSLRILLMNALDTKFLSPLIEMLSSKDVRYSNVLQILSFTLERIIIPDSEYLSPQHESVLECFSDHHLDANHKTTTDILDLFARAVRNDYFDDPNIVIGLLNIIGIFARSRSILILQRTIFDIAEDTPFFKSPMVLASWASKIIRIQRDQPDLKDEAFEIFNHAMINMRHTRLVLDSFKTRTLTFKDEGPISGLLCLQLSLFFTNTLEINDALINVLSDICQANGGLVTDVFITESLDNQDLMVLIWNYLWISYDSYSKQIQRDNIVTSMVPVSESLRELLKRLANGEDHHEQQTPSDIGHESLKMFRYVVNKLFVVSQASLILNNISFPNL